LAIQLGVVFETVERHLGLLADLDEARDIPSHKTARSWLAQFSAASILNTGGKGSPLLLPGVHCRPTYLASPKEVIRLDESEHINSGNVFPRKNAHVKTEKRCRT
jgi:hypothetical protein